MIDSPRSLRNVLILSALLAALMLGPVIVLADPGAGTGETAVSEHVSAETLDDALEAYDRGDPEEAVRILRVLAHGNDPQASTPWTRKTVSRGCTLSCPSEPPSRRTLTSSFASSAETWCSCWTRPVPCAAP